MRIIGLDIHRVFAEAVAWEDGKLRRIGRVDIRRDLLEKFACSLSPEDIVVVEATPPSKTDELQERVAKAWYASIPEQYRWTGKERRGQDYDRQDGRYIGASSDAAVSRFSSCNTPPVHTSGHRRSASTQDCP